MEDGRVVKAVVFGWLKNLEERGRKGKKRKTVLYWRGLIRGAAWDVTTVGKKAEDRKRWTGMVKEQMKHLAAWEDSNGKKYKGEVIERQQPNMA